jgi:CRISPR/Cas system-associated exonuclease Cas4 (RecB family)
VYWRLFFIVKSFPHPKITGVKIIENRNNFPISWLNKQAYCEYTIYIENFKGIEVPATKEMDRGKKEHFSLESEFKKKAVPTTFEEMLETSKEAEIYSRELPVISHNFGIRGFIDEVWMTPEDFIIIDDKPGKIPYYSNINQVYGYCLAFKDMIKDGRKVIASLRQRGTKNIFWSSYFDEKAENDIIRLIEHIHNLILGKKPFNSTNNPNKCKKCRFNGLCDEKIE